MEGYSVWKSEEEDKIFGRLGKGRRWDGRWTSGGEDSI